jgi:Phosphoesterase family
VSRAWLLAILGMLAAAASARAVPADPTGRFPTPARVAVLVLENRSFGQVIGSPDAPYLNRLARRYALATRYYAIGHPSLPNYLALLGGSTFDIRSDCRFCDIAARSLVAQLDAAHISRKAYFENLTSSARPGVRTRFYDPHYNPFVYYESVRDSSSGRSRVVDFDELDADLRRGRLPRFSWIAPSVVHDGHYARCRRRIGTVVARAPGVAGARPARRPLPHLGRRRADRLERRGRHGGRRARRADRRGRPRAPRRAHLGRGEPLRALADDRGRLRPVGPRSGGVAGDARPVGAPEERLTSAAAMAARLFRHT